MARFLIIDDHPLFREALQSAITLAFADVEAVEARSMDEALKALADNPVFDLALLDLNMPGTKGFEGLLELRTQYPRLPVVVVSGHEEARIITEALSYGVAGFIPKSAKKAELAAAISDVMNGSIHVPAGYDGPQTGQDNSRAELLAKLTSLTPQQLRVKKIPGQGTKRTPIAFELRVG